MHIAWVGVVGGGGENCCELSPWTAYSGGPCAVSDADSPGRYIYVGVAPNKRNLGFFVQNAVRRTTLNNLV